jgi:hypothetical protein
MRSVEGPMVKAPTPYASPKRNTLGGMLAANYFRRRGSIRGGFGYENEKMVPAARLWTSPNCCQLLYGFGLLA